MKLQKHHAEDRSTFDGIARSFSRRLRAGDVVALSGGVGAGKTTFVAAAVAALQGRRPTSSPTFLFWQRYPGPPPVEHLDFYRIDDPRDAIELGLHEAFETGNIVLVEWPERLEALLPSVTFRVHIAGCGEGARELTIASPH